MPQKNKVPCLKSNSFISKNNSVDLDVDKE